MIKASNLVKRYGSTEALRGVSFSVNKGEIFGLLGSNGAGKSTLMRILSGYMPANAGTVTFDGLDIFKHSLEIRRRIGYMPETVPLYTEMRVGEYLIFRASLKGLRRSRRWNRVHEVMNMCGLKGMERTIIDQLSKGNKQKVGLADSLLAEPDVLILDEPTIGLDPNQIRNVRTFLKELAPRQTIIISTHILSQIESLCDRIMILHEGKTITTDTPEAIISHIGGQITYVAELAGPRHDIVSHFNSNPRIIRVTAKNLGDWTRYELLCDKRNDIRDEIFTLAQKNQWKLRELSQIPLNLEDAFTALTQEEGAELT